MFIFVKKKIKFMLYKFKFSRQFLYNYKNNKKLHVFKKINLNEASTVVDLGGNVGLVSQYIYDHFKSNISIYEPHPGCLKVLKYYFKDNKKVKIFNKAVSNKIGKAKLYIHNEAKNVFDLNYSQSSSIEKRKKLNIKKFKVVNLESIQKITKKHKYIDLLKIDIEGHEYKILPFIFKNLDKFGKIYCELHGKYRLKNINFHKNYNYWVKKIKKNPAYNKKFFLWY